MSISYSQGKTQEEPVDELFKVPVKLRFIKLNIKIEPKEFSHITVVSNYFII